MDCVPVMRALVNVTGVEKSPSVKVVFVAASVGASTIHSAVACPPA